VTPAPPAEAVNKDKGETDERGWTVVTGCALFAAAVVVPLFRQSGRRSWDRVFSEDGFIYTQQALRNGRATSMFRGYAGYLQLPPRLLGTVVSFVPIRDLAVALAVAGTVTLALLGLFVYHVTRTWIASVPLRLALAATIVIGPAVGLENTANITNTIWAFAAVAPWALVSLEERVRDTALRAAVAFLAGTATPLCFVFAPVAVGWMIIRRTRSAVVVGGVFLIGLLVQGLVVLYAGDTTQKAAPNHVATLADEFTVRVIGFFLVGPKLIASWVSRPDARLDLLLLVLVIGLFGYLFLEARQSRWRGLAAVFVAGAILSFGVPIWARGTEDLHPLGLHVFLVLGYRYSVVPVFMLVSATAVLLAPGSDASAPVRRLAVPIFLVQLLVLAVLSFNTVPSVLLDWRASVADTYRTECHSHPSNRIVMVQTIPVNLQALVHTHDHYAVALRCRELAP
jgi:hypothetical protein